MATMAPAPMPASSPEEESPVPGSDAGGLPGASSGLPVTYAVIAGPGELDGNTLKARASGVVRVRAMQAGDGSYYAAFPVEREIRVEKD